MSQKCTVGGCNKPLKTKDLCQYHYHQKWAAARKAALPKCSCGRVVHLDGMCKIHYNQWVKHQEHDEAPEERIECRLDRCSVLAYAEGFCKYHYWDFLKALDLVKD